MISTPRIPISLIEAKDVNGDSPRSWRSWHARPGSFSECSVTVIFISPRREAEGLSRLHETITDWSDSGYTRRIPFIPGALPPWP